MNIIKKFESFVEAMAFADKQKDTVKLKYIAKNKEYIVYKNDNNGNNGNSKNK